MIDKKKLPTDLELALNFAKWEINKDENKDIIVTLPDGGVYVNSNLESIQDHATRNKLRIVSVKEKGKISTEATVKIEEVKEVKDTKIPNGIALGLAKSYIDKGEVTVINDGKESTEKIKDILVTLPDNAVYVNSDKKAIDEHAQKNNLIVIEVMKAGKVLIKTKNEEVEAVVEEEGKDDKKSKKK